MFRLRSKEYLKHAFLLSRINKIAYARWYLGRDVRKSEQSISLNKSRCTQGVQKARGVADVTMRQGPVRAFEHFQPSGCCLFSLIMSQRDLSGPSCAIIAPR